MSTIHRRGKAAARKKCRFCQADDCRAYRLEDMTEQVWAAILTDGNRLDVAECDLERIEPRLAKVEHNIARLSLWLAKVEKALQTAEIKIEP